MIMNRELTMDDYLAMLRRRMWVILVPALIAPGLGFAISYLVAAKYTSTSTVLVEGQKVPAGYVKPVVTEDVIQRITTLQQQVLSRSRLQPMIERLGLAKSGTSLEGALQDIRENVQVTPVASAGASKKKAGQSDVPGFNVLFTASDPRVAQQVCNQLTSMLLEENLKYREQAAQGTTEFLSRQVEEAKRTLDEQDAKLAAFKRQYVGQLPTDADTNLKILMGLNSQLEANTQTLNRAQQDKSYAESMLAQQVAAWKASQSTTSPQALDQQLAALQNQLLQLRARYTDDYPDVVKIKSSIAELQKQLEQMNSAKPDTSVDKANALEPPQIRQIRVQVHQYEQAIAQATQQQARLQREIKLYEGRVALSPAVEEQFKQLTRDYATAQKFYDDLLVKRNDSAMTTDMERQQQGQQFRLLNAANLPAAPSFPNRPLFAGGGLAVGLVLGLGFAVWQEVSDKSIRSEADVEAVMELPMLISLPWVGDQESRQEAEPHKAVRQPRDTDQEAVGV